MRVEQNGAETCVVASNGNFVLVRVPVRVVGEPGKAIATVRYQIGGFAGREASWPLRSGSETDLSFRIPRELFRERERIILEVLRTDDLVGQETLWSRRYDVRWANDAPGVEPIPD